MAYNHCKVLKAVLLASCLPDSLQDNAIGDVKTAISEAEDAGKKAEGSKIIDQLALLKSDMINGEVIRYISNPSLHLEDALAINLTFHAS